MRLLRTLALTLTFLTFCACTSKNGSKGNSGQPKAEVSDADLDSIREDNLPAISDADYEEYMKLADRLGRSYLPYKDIAFDLGAKLLHVPDPGGTYPMSSAQAANIKANCKLENPQDSENIEVRPIGNCPVGILVREQIDTNFHENQNNSTASAKRKASVSLRHLTPELQKEVGYVSINYTADTDTNIDITGKQGTQRIHKTMEAELADPQYRQISAKSLLRVTIKDEAVQAVQRVNLYLNGKLFVITYFKDKAPGTEARTRNYLGNRPVDSEYSFNLPLHFVGGMN